MAPGLASKEIEAINEQQALWIERGLADSWQEEESEDSS